MQEKIVYEFPLSGTNFRIETGEIAFQSKSSMIVTYGETTVLLTLNVGKSDKTLDFFPLSVDYSEKLYASGQISSSPYIKREGRPTDKEILSGRLIDHAIRSLFPSYFKNETQIIVQVLSYDKVNDPLLTAIIGVSFLILRSGLPYLGPYGASKVGFINDQLILNPTLNQMKESRLEMFVSSVKEGIVSVEADAHNLPDETIKEGIRSAIEANKFLIKKQEEFIQKFGKLEFELEVDKEHEDLIEKTLNEIITEFSSRLDEAIYIQEKKARNKNLSLIKEEILSKYKSFVESEELTEGELVVLFEKVCKKVVRKNILENSKRPDGRKIDEVRPLTMRTGVLPRVHGSALFTRGETQSLTIVTLGTQRDELMYQGLDGEESKRYFHHYNMPGYANGEVDRKFGFPNRRAIGHGNIGEKALKNVLPSQDLYPYTIRVVSEITSSNGSTSMAATCASSLALMDSGIPISDQIGGVGVGLVYESDSEYVILTDIIGMEDFYGDMDFKITGSLEGITAIQLDNKMSGIPVEVLMKAIDQSKTGRLHVISKMNECIDKPKDDLSKYAPKAKVIHIDQSKIGELIGPGGKVVKGIIEKTGVEVNIEDDGTVSIYSEEGGKFEEAMFMINSIVKDIQVGDEFGAEIVRVEAYGVFIEVPNTKIQGLVHVSNFGIGHIANAANVAKIGQRVKVKFLGNDEKGRTKFSIISGLEKPEQNANNK